MTGERHGPLKQAQPLTHTTSQLTDLMCGDRRKSGNKRRQKCTEIGSRGESRRVINDL